MVDSINIISSQGNTSRHAPQASAASAAVAAGTPVQHEFITSHIRVDNLQNVAILEYLSSATGEVVRQYPSQSQISAFKRAEQLQTESRHAPSAPLPQASTVSTTAPAIAVAAPPPAPAPDAAPAASGNNAGASSGGQSVLA